MELLAAKAAEQGELWKAYFDPSALALTVRSLGFNAVEDFGPEDLNELYFSRRLDGFRKSGVSRLVYARI
jgi:O-methyltransferase involved in polyketide biosynthesis